MLGQLHEIAAQHPRRLAGTIFGVSGFTAVNPADARAPDICDSVGMLATMRTCLDDIPPHDSLVAEMRRELDEVGSVLVLMRQYMRELVGSSHDESRPLMKFRRLFELGRVPELPSGHHYGVTLGLRTCNLRGPLTEFSNLLGYLWGVAIGRTCPWVGKSFAPMSAADRQQTLDTEFPADLSVARGINHFNQIHPAPTSRAGNALTSMLPLTKASAADHERWGHERDGGHFVSHRASSVYSGTPREVLRLDYRHPALHNNLPLPWLVDELVEITEGIYLGQSIFASDDAEYQHFGYFLLFDTMYDSEARELFPHLEIPAAVIELNKFKALTLVPEADLDAAPLDAIRRDLAASGTVLDMLKNYSDELLHAPVNDSPVFTKLHALFNAGIAPERMSGFWYGALVSRQSHGLFGAFDGNDFDIAWQICRPFSPWTGKCFDPVSPKRLAELTDGCETPPESIQLCTNTVALRRLRERAVHGMMKAMHLWVEDAAEQERRQHGYDAKAFFSIGKPACSVAAESHGKQVYQLNYRWKPLRNPAPDFLCIDEIVQIAEGLYLGRVYYSTKPGVAWSPETDPAEYGYQLFEYFMLMDEQWQARRLRLGFDLDNV
jgi:hypothetical protein